jgi:hypothetical protein
VSIVAEVWHALRAESRDEAGWHVRRVHEAASCEILAGIRRPGAIPGLLLELSLDDVPGGLSLPQSRGFSIEPSILGLGATGRVRFSLALADPSYEAVFAVLCEDAAATAAALSGPRAALRAWLGRLHVWQEFMSRHGAGGLGEEAAMGLFGELWFLRERLMPIVGHAAAVDAWAGPCGEPNDFSLPGGFVEVKSTARQAPETIDISDIDQLDDSRGTILLAHLHLLTDAEGQTLAQLIVSLRSIIGAEAPDRLRRFNDLLLAVGYADTPAAADERRWRVRRAEVYRVEGDFPRMRRADLPAGVRRCTYSIDRAACVDHAAPDDAIERLATGSTHG